VTSVLDEELMITMAVIEVLIAITMAVIPAGVILVAFRRMIQQRTLVPIKSESPHAASYLLQWTAIFAAIVTLYYFADGYVASSRFVNTTSYYLVYSTLVMICSVCLFAYQRRWWWIMLIAFVLVHCLCGMAALRYCSKEYVWHVLHQRD
jgi:hypothetical protein